MTLVIGFLIGFAAGYIIQLDASIENKLQQDSDDLKSVYDKNNYMED